MPYCPNCGVELGASALKCPLCGASAVAELGAEERSARAALGSRPKEEGSSPSSPKAGSPEAELAASAAGGRERDTLRWEVLSVSTLISAIAVCAVNLLTTGNLSWALYPLSSLAFVWVVLTALIELRAKPALGLPIAFVALPAYLLALDFVEGRVSWAWPIGIPIAIIVEASFGLAFYISKLTRWRPLLAMSFFFLAATLSCLGIEGSLSLALLGGIRIRWSGVVAASLIPVSGFLTYVHVRVLHNARIRRLFRL